MDFSQNLVFEYSNTVWDHQISASVMEFVFPPTLESTELNSLRPNVRLGFHI